MNNVSDKRESSQIQTTANPMLQANNRSNCRLYFYNGTHHMVFVDNQNGNKEYIFDEKGKKLYLDEIAILQFNNEKQKIQDKLISSFDEQEKKYEAQKEIWYNKFKAENKKYDIFRAAKLTAQKGYRKILSLTSSSSLSDVKEYDKANGSGYFQQARDFLAQRSDASQGQIGAESMAAFYGRMYVDECDNVRDMSYMKNIANSIFAS